MSSLLKTFEFFNPSDYKVATWLLIGASLQCILVASLPLTISSLPPIVLLLYRFIRGYLIANRSLPNPLEKGVVPGRQTWQVPAADGSAPSTGSTDSIVVVIVAASWTHPNGRLSPGSAQMGEYIAAMWKDAEQNREKYGFLGNTPALVTEEDASRPDSYGSQSVSISYWKTLEGLHKFSTSEAHMKGLLWFERTASKQFKHIGVAHEVYEAPAGSWENVFVNFKPFALSNAKYPINKPADENSKDVKESVEWVSPMRPAKGKNWRSMYSRMGRQI